LKLHRPKQIKVFLPTTLSLYAAHYRKRADEKVITRDQAERLIAQLETFQKRNPDGIIVNSNNPIVDQMAYYERNQAIIDASDELIAFQINKSKGTQDTIDKAKTKGIPVIIHSYSL
jgi:ABC-type sugar transport system substrate-binding protein